MAIAHLCLACGTDLARTRPIRDGHYRLPIIICPKCNLATVRRVHPIWAWWNRFRRLDATLRVLTIQLVAVLALGSLSTMLCLALLMTGAAMLRQREVDHLVWLLFWTFGVLAPVIGAWLTAGFTHATPWRVWLGWWSFLVLLLIAPVLISAGIEEMPPELESIRDKTRSMWSEGMRLIIIPGAVVHLAIMTVALAGIPIGKLLLWLNNRLQTVIWRMRRRRRRMARTA